MNNSDNKDESNKEKKCGFMKSLEGKQKWPPDTIKIIRVKFEKENKFKNVNIKELIEK